MLGAIARAAGLSPDASPAVVIRGIVDSLAAGTAVVLDRLGGVTNLQMIGGASRWRLLRQRITELTGVPVAAGPVGGHRARQRPRAGHRPRDLRRSGPRPPPSDEVPGMSSAA